MCLLVRVRFIFWRHPIWGRSTVRQWLVRVPNPLLWKMVGCTIPKKHGNFTSGPSRAFIWSRTGKKRWKLARWVSQQEILLWLHSDSFTECRDTAILRPPPICHFSRPNATLWEIQLENWTNPLPPVIRNEVANRRRSHVFWVLCTQLTFKSVGEPD